MSFWFRTWREHSDDPQNTMLAEIYRLLLQTRSEVTGAGASNSDLERKRVDIIPNESYIIIVSGDCFVHATQRSIWGTQKYYAAREPDADVCRCWYVFDHRANELIDKSLIGNNALMKGMPIISSYQSEYMASSLKLNGIDSYADMGTTTNLKLGETASSEVTVAFWIYFPSNPASDAHIVSRGDTQSYVAFIDTTGRLKVTFFYQDGTNVTLDSTITGTGAHHRVMISHSDINNISKIFVDGVLKASNTKNDFLRNSGTTSSSRFMIGAKSTGANTQSNFVNGNVDNVMVWKRQLTDDEAMDDYLGEHVSNRDLVSEWTFDEDESSTKTVDSVSYNTGTIVNTVYDKLQVPTQTEGPIPYRDGVVNYLVGYRTTGQQYLIIPELSEDFRLSDHTDNGRYYSFLIKLSTFDKTNNRYMRLLQKADDFNGDFIQSIQIRDDGRVYLVFKFNGVEEKVRTVDPLKLGKLYYLKVGIDFSWVPSGNALDMFKIYLNGINVGIEETTDASDLPDAADIKDFHTYLLAADESLKGNYVGNAYEFRCYEEKLTDALALNLATNKYTTYRLDRGTIAISNLTKLPESSPYRPQTFTFPSVPITESFDFFITDDIPTGRFNNDDEPIAISDEFDFTLSTGSISLGNYSAQLNGVSFIEVPTIKPISGNFSLSLWVYYEGRVGSWAGIISRVDGKPNGNRLLLRSNEIRWHGQFNSSSSSWKDYRVTVPNLTGVFHHIGVTYNGAPNEFKIFLDGNRVARFTDAQNPMMSGEDQDNGKTYIGKGADNDYFLIGKLDEMVVYNTTLTDAQMRSNYLRSRTIVGTMAYWKFERDLRDSHNGFHGNAVGNVEFSSVNP